MGLDSVEIVLSWEESFGISIPDCDVENMLTPRQAINYLSIRLNAKDIPNKPCISQRAFYVIRRTLAKHFSACRSDVQPDSFLRDLLPEKGKKHIWKQFVEKLGFGTISVSLGLPLLGAGSTTVNDLVTELTSCHATKLVSDQERWSRHQIRNVVRKSVEDVAGVRDFSDDDRFFQDIGID